jgi:hypothetical protein
MISTGRWLELCETDAERRAAAVVQGSEEAFSARVSGGSLAAPEEITVCRLLDGWRTHDLVYRPDAEGNFVFQEMRER